MKSRKAPTGLEQRTAFDVERRQQMTVVRFHTLDMLAWSELSLAGELWDFFESERSRPSPLLVLLAPPGLLDRASLERLLAGSSNEGVSNDLEFGRRIVRVENMIHRFIENVRDLNSFVIGAADGEIALRLAAPFLACDYHVVGPDSAFVNTTQSLPLAPFGCLPWVLTRMVGGARTMQLLLDVPRLSANGAFGLGLVNHITAPDQFEEETLEVAERLASLPKMTLTSLKRTMVASCEDLGTYIERERACTESHAAQHRHSE